MVYSEETWDVRCAVWITAAKTADKYRKRTGGRHPTFGAGFLADAVGPIVRGSDSDYGRFLRAKAKVCCCLETARDHHKLRYP